MSNVEQAAVVDEDLVCIGCRYNLRTLPVEGKCPECGELVGRSMEVARSMGEPAWCGRIRAGLALYLISCLLGGLPAVAIWIERFCLNHLPFSLLPPFWFFELVLTGLPAALLVFSTWVMTTPRRLSDGSLLKNPWRGALRAVAVAHGVTWLVFFVVFEFFLLSKSKLAFVGLAQPLVFHGIVILWNWLLFRYAGEMLSGLKRARLARQSVVLAWVLSGSQAVTLIRFIIWTATRSPFLYRSTIMQIMFGTVGMISILAAIWGFVLLVIARRRLALLMPVPAGYWADVLAALGIAGRGVKASGRYVARMASHHGAGTGEG